MRVKATVAVLTTGALVVALGCVTRGVADQPWEEIYLSDHVEAVLAADEALSDAEIKVDTEDGVVMLQGGVTSQAAWVRAEDLARQVPGVLDVINVLEVGDGEYHPVIYPGGVSEYEDSTESMQDPSW